MTTEHTPTPWSIGNRVPSMIFAVDRWIANCTLGSYTDADEAQANAAFIVKACNAHDELVAALRLIDKAHADCVRYADTSDNWRSHCAELANIASRALAKVMP